MAWCPKCKNEYREGITVCADCGTKLVEVLDESTMMHPLLFGDKELLEGIVGFLKYGGIEDTELIYNEKESYYELHVMGKDYAKAEAGAKVFLMKQKEAAMKEAANNREEAIETLSKEDSLEFAESSEYTDTKCRKCAEPRPQIYESNQSKAENNMSSAWALLAIGIGGSVFEVLCFMEIVPFGFKQNPMFHGILCVMFFIFLCSGVMSLKKAKSLQGSVDHEKEYTEKIIQWGTENLDGAKIDAKINMPKASIEELYFRRYEIVKKAITEQFPEEDEMFVDRLIDDVLFEKIFGDTTSKADE